MFFMVPTLVPVLGFVVPAPAFLRAEVLPEPVLAKLPSHHTLPLLPPSVHVMPLAAPGVDVQVPPLVPVEALMV